MTATVATDKTRTTFTGILRRIARSVTTKSQRQWLRRVIGRLTSQRNAEIDVLYRLLYEAIHDKENALSLASSSTQEAFSTQWKELPSGRGLLSDPWFKGNVARIISEEELQVNPKWFKGKDVLDAGCGNGRWSYGLAQLGCNVTAVDVNEAAIQATKEALAPFDISKQFITSPLESLSNALPSTKFDLVWSWGVVHHCHSFNQALNELANLVKEGGLLYLYLYGRESISLEEELPLFKQRVAYHTLPSSEAKMAFLHKRAGGDASKIHEIHDIFAPLINRRLDFTYVADFLTERGFVEINRTIDNSEIMIRAIKAKDDQIRPWILPKRTRPYWFERYA